VSSGQFPNLRHWPLPNTAFAGRRRGRWLSYSDTRRSTVFIDLDTWPPKLAILDTEFVSSFDVLPDGRLVVCSMLTRPESEYMVRIHSSGWPTEAVTEPPRITPTPIPGESCQVYSIGNLVIAFDSLIERTDPEEVKRAYALKTSRFRPVAEIPKVQRFRPGNLAQQVYDNGKVTLADGTDLLIWDGNGYELKLGRLQRTCELAAQVTMGLGGWTAVPWGQDGFFFLSDGRVMYARRGTKPILAMPDADNVMSLSPGPENSVIVSHGKNRKALAARVWFPEVGSYIPITRKHLGIAPYFSANELYWSAATRHVYTKFGDLLTFSDSDLLAVKRVRPRDAANKVWPRR
jgi:hypothetical protein